MITQLYSLVVLSRQMHNFVKETLILILEKYTAGGDFFNELRYQIHNFVRKTLIL